MNIKAGVFLCAGILALSPLVAAEEGKPNRAQKQGAVTPDATAVGALGLAAQLVLYGLSAKDPLALVLAVRLTQQVPLRDEARGKTSKPGAGKEEDKAVGGQDRHSVDYLLAQAREFSGGKAEVLALIEGMQTGSSKGAVGGAGRHRDRINARAIDEYAQEWEFEGDELARIVVRGDGDTDLDCVVLDENGNEVARDSRESDLCLLEWTPAWTGSFSLAVFNLGNVYNDYTVTWN